MQPYQEANEEIKNQRERPFYAAASLASRALPLLSTYIPANIAMKGLSKVDSRLGQFMGAAQEMGHDIGEIRNFMADKIAPVQEQGKVEDSIKEKVWNAFQAGKTKHSDPDISGFLKIASRLKNYRGLNTKDQFTQLWDEFELLRNEGKSLPEMIQALVESHSSRLPKAEPSARRQQQTTSSEPMNNLMQALQAAAQSRQKRQQPPM